MYKYINIKNIISVYKDVYDVVVAVIMVNRVRAIGKKIINFFRNYKRHSSKRILLSL